MNSSDKYIQKYGTEISYKIYGQNMSIKAIMQPFHYSYKSYYESKRYPSGKRDGRHYLLILRSTMASVIYTNMKFYKGDKVYRVKTFETYRYKGEVLYVRALLTPCADI